MCSIRKNENALLDQDKEAVEDNDPEQWEDVDSDDGNTVSGVTETATAFR